MPEKLAFPVESESLVGLLVVCVPEEQVGDFCIDFLGTCNEPPGEDLIIVKGTREGRNWIRRPGPDELKGACITVEPGQAPPKGLECALEGNKVFLSWINCGQYFRIEVTRDGKVLASLEGSKDSFVDHAVSCGAHIYTVQAFADCYGYEPLACEVTCLLYTSPSPRD